MADIRIESQGFSIGRLCFPAFALRGGECVTLCLPREAWVDEDQLVACLTGLEPVPGLKLHATLLYAKPASGPAGWRRWFQNPTPFDWMKRNTPLSEDAIRSILLEHKIDLTMPLSCYAGTPRALLGLEAAYARRPGVVVFSSSGLDPMGVRTTFGIVAEHLPECSAIYLAWPFDSQDQIHRYSFPGSTDVMVIDKASADIREVNYTRGPWT